MNEGRNHKNDNFNSNKYRAGNWFRRGLYPSGHGGGPPIGSSRQAHHACGIQLRAGIHTTTDLNFTLYRRRNCCWKPVVRLRPRGWVSRVVQRTLAQQHSGSLFRGWLQCRCSDWTLQIWKGRAYPRRCTLPTRSHQQRRMGAGDSSMTPILDQNHQVRRCLLFKRKSVCTTLGWSRKRRDIAPSHTDRLNAWLSGEAFCRTAKTSSSSWKVYEIKSQHG